MRSPFRPEVVPDAAILDDHKPLIRSLERRGVIRGGLSLGALVVLTGCDVKRPEAVEAALLAISRLNDGVQALLFDPNKLAPTYPASMILRPPKFNAYYDVMDVKPVNGATWRLEVSGRVADKRPGHCRIYRRCRRPPWSSSISASKAGAISAAGGGPTARLPGAYRRGSSRQIRGLQDGR